MSNIKDITTPILLIGFNRPDVIKKSFDFIRKAKPQKLFVAIDGPRKHVQNESQLVQEVKGIVKSVDWDCETHYKFNNVNLGAEITVSSAVSWVLENEDTVIVLEDDIIGPMSFINFAQVMLKKYFDEDNIYMISGGQFTPIIMPNNEDYLFAQSGHTGCGWATWKRAWSYFNLYVDDFDSVLETEFIDKHTHSKEERKLRRKNILRMMKKGAGNNTWDVCWSFIRFKQQGLSIIPRVNLTSNIGVYGLHARGETEGHYRPYDENFVAINHPKKVKRNVEYDKHHFEQYLNRKPPLYKRLSYKISRVVKSFKNEMRIIFN